MKILIIMKCNNNININNINESNENNNIINEIMCNNNNINVLIIM